MQSTTNSPRFTTTLRTINRSIPQQTPQLLAGIFPAENPQFRTIQRLNFSRTHPIGKGRDAHAHTKVLSPGAQLDT
jgi:hypothetical protein